MATFHTKFDMGQLVHVIRRSLATKVLAPCPTCLETGQISVRGDAFICPRCKGAKRITETAYVWHVSESSTVGQIEVRTREPDDDDESATETRYMLRATGVGTGTVYGEDELWPGTREDAATEAERRNRDGE